MPAAVSDLGAGFVDHVVDSQAVFRAVLNAMSRPGRLFDCPVHCDAPSPLQPCAAAVALTLFNHETPVWLDPHLNTIAVRKFLAFHTSAPIGRDMGAAAFALVGDPNRMPRLDDFRTGSSLHPDHGATLLIQLESLRAGAPVTLSGPGIESPLTFRPTGLPKWFWNAWEHNHDSFPRGIDLILSDGKELAALPRTAERM